MGSFSRRPGELLISPIASFITFSNPSTFTTPLSGGPTQLNQNLLFGPQSFESYLFFRSTLFIRSPLALSRSGALLGVSLGFTSMTISSYSLKVLPILLLLRTSRGRAKSVGTISLLILCLCPEQLISSKIQLYCRWTTRTLFAGS
jgi:hypothetical protein